jgi:RHS repeat-associated protein
MQAGLPPNVSFSGSNFDQVSYQNGNLHISIPIVDIPQRNGKTYSYHFVYNLPSWTILNSWQVNPSPGFSGQISLGSQFLNWGLASNVSGWTIGYTPVGIECTNNLQYGLITGVTLTDPEGTIHPVLLELTNGAPSTCAQNISAGLTTDGTGILVTGTWTGGAPTFTATLKDGTQLPLSSGPRTTWEDSNGNEMSATADMLKRTPLTVSNAANTTYTSPLGNKAIGPASTTWAYKDSNGTNQSFTLYYEAIDIQTSFDTSIATRGVAQFSCACVVPASLTLPNGGGVYTFTWQNDDTGELQSIGLPTGGSISYTYQPGPAIVSLPNGFNVKNCAANGTDCTETETIREEVTKRTVTDNTGTHLWGYTWASGTAGGATVTDPLGNIEVHTYGFLGSCATGEGCTSVETEVQYENPAGTVLRTVTKGYDYDAINGGPGDTDGGVGNVRLTSETTTLNDVTPNLVKQVSTNYEVISANYIAPGTTYNTSWLNPTSVTETDWGSGSPGSVLRYTTYTYLHDPTNNPSGYSNYLSRNIADKVLVKTVYDSTSGTCKGVVGFCAETGYTYDGYSGNALQASSAIQQDPNYAASSNFTYRGNPTTVCHYLITTGSCLNTTNQYYDTGDIFSVTDPLGNKTTYNRTDSWFQSTCAPSGQGAAYVTTLTNALSQKTTYKFDSCTGLLASVTDPNSQITSYTYDFLNRLAETSFPPMSGGTPTVTTTYNDTPPFSETTTTTITSSLNKVATIVRDDLGRISQTQLNSDPSGVDYTVTTYDALGRKSQVYNPTRCSPPITNCGTETTWGDTAYTYDALSRIITVTEADGSATHTSYDQPCTSISATLVGTIVIDEVGNQREPCNDGLGRLTGVLEAPNVSGYNLSTTYQYDALDDLTNVTQNGNSSSNPRVRNFVYDSLARLTSATNPESGTITYTYDSDGNVLTRLAPQANQTGTAQTTTTYTYDALNRRLSTTHTNPNGFTSLYAYDGGAISGCVGVSVPSISSPTNLIGRRSGMCAQQSASSFSYDPMGRISLEARTNSYQNPAPITLTTGYQYYLEGSLYTLTYPSGDVVTYTVDGAGRPLGVSDASNNYVASATYAPQGALAGMANGNTSSFSGIITTNTYNDRLQPILLSTAVPTISVSVTSGTYGTCTTLPCTAVFTVSSSAGINVDDILTVTGNTDSELNGTFTVVAVASGQVTVNFELNTSGGSGSGGTLIDDISGSIFSICYDFHLGQSVSSGPCSLSAYSTGNNGNVFQVLNNVESTRSATFTYDSLNRLTQANTVNTTSANANCWGESYTIDAWGNLTNIAGAPGMAGSCSSEMLNAAPASTANQLNGYSYDAAGNLLLNSDFYYDAENRLYNPAAPYTYLYDADGLRTRKAASATVGTIYWPGTDGEVLTEANGSGTVSEDYIYFNGSRIARVDRPSGTVHYYFSDQLGSASTITSSSGSVEEQYYYYPYGGLVSTSGSDTNHYLFTGKERDNDSGEYGLDYFGARHYGSVMGRFMTPDLDNDPDEPGPTPFAEFRDPQTLNLYAYVRNNPLNRVDPDGHKLVCNSSSTTDEHGNIKVKLDCHEEPDQPTVQQQPSAVDLFRTFLNSRGADPEDRKAVMWSMFGQVLRGNLGNINDFLPHPDTLGPKPSIPTIPLQAIKVLDAIDASGITPAGVPSNGRNFQNDGRNGGQVLPPTDGNGNQISYREWDINPRGPGGRGAERIVTGSDGSAYYTADHYRTFEKIR